MGKTDPGHLIEAVLTCKVTEPAYKGQSDYVSIVASASAPPALPPAGQLLLLLFYFVTSELSMLSTLRSRKVLHMIFLG